jgi:hypothetical protein
LEDPGVDDNLITTLILKKYGGRMFAYFIWLRTGTSEHGK